MPNIHSSIKLPIQLPQHHGIDARVAAAKRWLFNNNGLSELRALIRDKDGYSPHGVEKFLNPNNVPNSVDVALWEMVSDSMPMSIQREFSKRRRQWIYPTDRAIKEWLVWQSKDKLVRHKKISYANSAAGRRKF